MKPIKLLAAVMPAFVIASQEAANVSTTTVVQPVSTRTHTSIILVTATAGSVVNTCLASLCGSGNSSVDNLSTIRLTSFTTATTTQVITRPDATTTISSETVTSVPTSCAMRSRSTITVTVTETSTPVITRSVYPVPASSTTNAFATYSTSRSETHTTPLSDKSSSSSASSVLSSPPYLNRTYTSTLTSTYTSTLAIRPSNVTQHLPLQTKIPAVPLESPVHLPVTEVSSSSSADAMRSPTSFAGRVRPSRFFALLTRFLSLSTFVKAQSQCTSNSKTCTTHAVSETCWVRESAASVCRNKSTSSHTLMPHFGSFPMSSNPKTASYLTKVLRHLLVSNISVTSDILGTIVSTSTIVFTATQHPQGNSPMGMAFPSIPVPVPTSALSSLLTNSNPPPIPTSVLATLTNGATQVSAASSVGSSDGPASSIHSGTSIAASGSYSSWWSSVHGITVFVTTTEPAISTFVSATVTSTHNVTRTFETHHTHTLTVSDTSAPTVTNAAGQLDFSISYIVLAMWIVLGAIA